MCYDNHTLTIYSQIRIFSREGGSALDKIRRTLFRSWYTLETLEDRIYHIILDVAVFAAVCTLAAGAVFRFPASALWATAVIFLYLVVLQFITIRHPKHAHTCRFLLVAGMNLVLFPGALYASGGIHGGMILFYLCGLFLCAILVRGRTGGILFLISLIVMTATLVMSVYLPRHVQRMTEKQQLDYMAVCLVLAGLALYSITILIIRSYSVERAQNEELMQKLRELSMIDALTGLCNRRELFRRLELLYGADAPDLTGRYILMFDVDDFKKLNDTYGHSFGDGVLATASGVMRDLLRPEDGELFSRYGGEEFVGLVSADSAGDAYARGDAIRRRVSELRWPEFPEVRVSVSGGLISCEDHPDLTQALHDVDVLLYEAKAAGKNRIVGPAA